MLIAHDRATVRADERRVAHGLAAVHGLSGVGENLSGVGGHPRHVRLVLAVARDALLHASTDALLHASTLGARAGAGTAEAPPRTEEAAPVRGDPGTRARSAPVG